MRGSCASMGDTGEDSKRSKVRRGKGSRVRSGGNNRPWISQATGKQDPPPWWGAERGLQHSSSAATGAAKDSSKAATPGSSNSSGNVSAGVLQQQGGGQGVLQGNSEQQLGGLMEQVQQQQREIARLLELRKQDQQRIGGLQQQLHGLQLGHAAELSGNNTEQYVADVSSLELMGSGCSQISAESFDARCSSSLNITAPASGTEEGPESPPKGMGVSGSLEEVWSIGDVGLGDQGVPAAEGVKLVGKTPVAEEVTAGVGYSISSFEAIGVDYISSVGGTSGVAAANDGAADLVGISPPGATGSNGAKGDQFSCEDVRRVVCGSVIVVPMVIEDCSGSDSDEDQGSGSGVMRGSGSWNESSKQQQQSESPAGDWAPSSVMQMEQESAGQVAASGDEAASSSTASVPAVRQQQLEPPAPIMWQSKIFSYQHGNFPSIDVGQIPDWVQDYVNDVASFGEAQGLGKVVFKLNGLAVALSPIPYEEVSCFPDGHGVLAWLEDVCNNVHQESLQQVLVWFTQLRAEGNDEAWAISGGTWCVCVSMLVAAAQLLCLLQSRAQGYSNEVLMKIDVLGAIAVEGLVRWC